MIERIKVEVPQKPGCYIYRNQSNEIIYIGKAKNLKKRMMSYFNRVQNLKTTKLVSEIVNFEYFITNTERESLILENRLIKEHQPKYNIMLKDDKTYPYLVITNEEHPRVLKVRNKKLKGEYFGPYPDNSFVNTIIEYINPRTQLRKCRILPREECIYYHLNQCYAPCIKYFSPEEVKTYTEEVRAYLQGNMTKLKRDLQSDMEKAAMEMDFESAAVHRDLITKIDDYRSRQVIDLKTDKDFDVIGIYHDNTDISISIINFEAGAISNIEYLMNSYYTDMEETACSMLFNYYQNKNLKYFLTESDMIAGIMESIIISEKMNDYLKDYQEVISLANLNAREYFKNNAERLRKKTLKTENAGFKELERIVGKKLEYIEMFDISHLGGDAQVAGKVVYQNGMKNPKLYRKYKIKNAARADEYGSMHEVLFRRLSRVVSGEENVPDLIILDGGKGQMKVALTVLAELEINVPLVGLVKDDKHRTRAMINKNYDEHILKINTDLYKFLYNIQEEVHRYAIDFHHKSRQNQLLKSELDNIPGVGLTRKKILLTEFKSIEAIKNASIDELIMKKIPKNVAQNIIKYFHEKE